MVHKHRYICTVRELIIMYTPLPLSLITVKYLYTTVLDFVITGGAQVEENPGRLHSAL
jgi:hypothetical protein